MAQFVYQLIAVGEACGMRMDTRTSTVFTTREKAESRIEPLRSKLMERNQALPWDEVTRIGVVELEVVE